MVISDNGPQFTSQACVQLAGSYQFHHITSSPYFPQSNGEAGRAVTTVKSLLNKSADPYLALLTYRSTPLPNGFSPSELLMSRVLRSSVPTTVAQRRPRLLDIDLLREKEEQLKNRQKENFDKHHGARRLPALSPGDKVWIPDQEMEGNVVDEVMPQSFEVRTENGVYRRNIRHLIRARSSLRSEEGNQLNTAERGR